MGIVHRNDGDRRSWTLPNRIATMLLLAFGVAGAALPVLADMDWESTAGILGGLGAVAAAIVVYLRGWVQHESENLVAYQPKAQERAAETIYWSTQPANGNQALVASEQRIVEDFKTILAQGRPLTATEEGRLHDLVAGH